MRPIFFGLFVAFAVAKPGKYYASLQNIWRKTVFDINVHIHLFSIKGSMPSSIPALLNKPLDFWKYTTEETKVRLELNWKVYLFWLYWFALGQQEWISWKWISISNSRWKSWKYVQTISLTFQESIDLHFFHMQSRLKSNPILILTKMDFFSYPN